MKPILPILLFLTLLIHAQNGIVRSYYANHKIRVRLSYVNDVLDSKSIWYYENGNIKTIKTFNLGKLNGRIEEFYESGLPKEEYFAVDGIRNGFDRIYWENGALKEIRLYKMGELIKRTKIDYDSLFIPNDSDYKGIVSKRNIIQNNEKALCDVDICPSPIGGISAVQARVKYPEEAKLYGLEGKVSITATIDTNGSVSDAKIIEGLGLGCDEAALNAVRESKFLPGHNGGKIVTSHLTVNILFELNNKQATSLNKHKQFANEYFFVDKNSLPLTNIEDSLDAIITQTEAPQKKIKLQISDTVISNEAVNSKTSNNIKEIGRKRGGIKPPNKITIVKCSAEKCPEPIGGIKNLTKRFEIPYIAYKLKLKGYVVIDARIDQWGNVLNTKIVKDVGKGVGTAAEIAILFTKFKPGRQDGENVESEVRIILPVDTKKKM